MGAAFLGVALFLFAETVAVGLWHRALFAGPWEFEAALTELAPIAALAAFPIALLAALLSLLLEESSRTSPRVLLSAVSSFAAGTFAFGISNGPHFDRVPLRIAFISVAAVLAAAVGFKASPYLSGWRQRVPGRFGVLIALALAAAVTANVLVLPRLYPPFHWTLAAIALVLAAWIGELFFAVLEARWIAIAFAVALAGLGYAAVRGVKDLANRDNVRLVYHRHAPHLSYAVRLTAALSRDATSTQVSAPALRQDDPGRSWIDWRNRDILLITVDALRADHVGAYGYGRPTTPEIDTLAREGVLFDRAYCAMPHTSYSITSLMTGKYIRPLMLQGAGADSDTFAGLMRLYGYRTAAFFPPSLFVVDRNALQWAEDKALDFEYRKIEYAPAMQRYEQVARYVERSTAQHNLFLWVHLFEPHEPYEPHPAHDFGDRDVDHYDAEIAEADGVVGKLARLVRERRPGAVVILTGDHGEEFGEHGGYYHGTTVFEEQVRVPLVVSVPGTAPTRVAVPVQLVDVLPTMLNALGVPRTPRLRGNDLGPWIAGEGKGSGFAFAESYDQVLLAEDSWRLVCERKANACSLYDVQADPGERNDRAVAEVDRADAMRKRLRELESSHGSFELSGARLEGKALPPALVRGIAGDVNAARDVAALLDDADVVIRRRAAQVLFDLENKDASPALSLALTRDDDPEVRRWCALALTRMGQGAPLSTELLEGQELQWKRLAAFAFAASGDPRGEAVLVEWWSAGELSFERSKAMVGAFAKIKSKAAVVPLTRSLDDVHLRPHIAVALAAIGDPYGRIALNSRFATERYENSRRAMAQALVDLGAAGEMAPSLTRFLGVSDPMVDGVRIALAAKLTGFMGGPEERVLAGVRHAPVEGISVPIVVPKGGNGTGFRVLIRARAVGNKEGTVRFGLTRAGMAGAKGGPAVDRLEPATSVTLQIASRVWQEVFAQLPAEARLQGGKPAVVIVVPDGRVEIDGFVVVPLADEIPPPPPERWDGPRDDESTPLPGHR